MNNIDFSQPDVLLLFGGLTFAILIFMIVLFIVFRLFKLYIPKSKLFNDDYIKQSIRNTSILRKSCLVVFTIQVIVAVLWHFNIISFIPKDSFPFIGIFIVFMTLMMVIGLGPVLVRSRHYTKNFKEYLNGTDINNQIRNKRMYINRKL
ncbi:hypothetical protein [Breznakia pachnodae]|uniref:Magnesium-transporting ATPase (P-type) n=1 Tax=Breznakia pachnodae TaxID=265178 RepID=A0ABU0E1D6_9FIRM|nr:hypothetical protein [Breznakia pachnodae]MDQ0360693.1 magnesium-transporting ATPase (P-type) [Breznakia pachnodae]